MPDNFVLPIPQLLTTEILNLGPVIDPPFSDARNWSKFLAQVETKPVPFEMHESLLTKESSRQFAEFALASPLVERALTGKRYQIIGVGMRSLDRHTEYPLVVIYNYTDDIVVEVAVDSARTTVTGVRLERYQPPVAEPEMRRAIDIIRNDGRLQKGGVDVETGTGIIVELETPDGARRHHRVVDLRFGPEDRRLPTAWAIVDLTTEEVVKTGIYSQEQAQ